MNPDLESHQASFNDCYQKQQAKLAMEITEQDWSMLGMEDELCPRAAASSSLEVTTDRLTALFVMRLVALAAPVGRFSDYSTTTICQEVLESDLVTSIWPSSVTEAVVHEVQRFVRTMLTGYNDVHYHNFEHAYHVVISANKLLDMILVSESSSSSSSMDEYQDSDSIDFDEDTLLHLSLLFAALIHDVEHQGVPNQQLIIENDPLALQYNDQSIAEQRSLSIGFTELLQSDYDNLREIMFPETYEGGAYRRFRNTVTSLVLATDIASPERGDIVKKKWTQAFGEVSVSTPPRVFSKQASRGKLRRKQSLTTPLKAPREHPSPHVRRSQVTKRASVQKAPEETKKAETKKGPLESWVELGATPSTHFPRGAGASMNDSLSFWWFCASEAGDDDDSISLSTFGDDSNDDFDPFYEIDARPSNQFCGDTNGDMEMSITLFPEPDAVKEPLTPADLSDSYPCSSQAPFQYSCSTLGSTDFQHLLSPSKVSRLNRIVSKSSNGASAKNKNNKGQYSDLGQVSGDGKDGDSKPKGFLGALSACTPKLKKNKAVPAATEIKSMISKFSSLDFMSSTGTMTTVTESSSSSLSSSKLRFDSSDQGDLTEEVEPDTPLPEVKEVVRDTELCKVSLLEHILLVSDVAHTMQGWDVMIKFAHHLSEEIQNAITAGRSGGNTDDPLSDWYSNQSAFMNGYILPLAERLEKTGYVPTLENQKSGFLSNNMNSNLDRWQDQGHDVVVQWRKMKAQKEKKEEKRLSKTKSKTKKKHKKGKKTKDSKKGEKQKDGKKRSSKKSSLNKTRGSKSQRDDWQNSKGQLLPTTLLEPFSRGHLLVSPSS